VIKIAHFADIHWRGLTRHQEYKLCFEDAFEKLRKAKPDIILVAGDVVHSKTQGISPELIDCLTWWFTCLSEIAPTHITLGNHDGLIQNEDRLDAISPIISAMNNPKIFLHKKSCVVKIAEKYNLCVLSCFDKGGWSSVLPVSGETNIATFHGPVEGSVTDENWKIDGEVSLDFFEKFDFSLLGDIHKLQFLSESGRIAYSGSTIQQNYGESQEKGFLLWAIENKQEFVTKFVQVKNRFPYVTLVYDGSVDSLIAEAVKNSETSRFRVKIPDGLSQSEISSIKSSLKSSCKPTEIVFKQDKAKSDVCAQIKQNMKIDSLESVEKMVFDYHSGANISEKTKETVASFLKNAWHSAKIDEASSGGSFQIKSLEFDNTFGYGEGNLINFDSAEGITGIFGRNASGKSSICGTLAYGLYNGTDRGSLKNLHVINTRKNYCSAKIKFSKSGTDYLLERQSTKLVSKKGEVSAPTNLNLFLIDPVTGETKDMSEEQRRETEKTLRDLVGNLEDFLLTSLSSQGNMNKFIDLSAAARKSSLARFLRLEIFDQLNDAIKDDLNATKKMLDLSSDKNFDDLIRDLSQNIEKNTAEREFSEKMLEKAKSEILALQSVLSSVPSEIYTKLEIDEQEKKIEEISSKILSLRDDMSSEEQKNEALLHKKNELKTQAVALNKDELLKKKSELDDAVKSVMISEQKIEKKSTEISRDRSEVDRLSDVPCGDSFPGCKYIVSAKNAKKNLEQKQEELEKIQTELETAKRIQKKLVDQSVEEKLKNIKEISEKISQLNLDISASQNEKTRISGKIENLESLFEEKNKVLQKMNVNVCDASTAVERESLIKKKKELEDNAKNLQLLLSKASENIGRDCAKLSQVKSEKEEFAIRSHRHQSLKLLNKALSKNGIPLNVIRMSLPAINEEIHSILQTSVGFTAELVSDEDSSDMEVYINYGDSSSRRMIECASGMEKMMASIAIRAALIRTSNLPKSDIFIIDEGFGTLDGKNIELCSSLLRELSKYFKSVLIISHIDTIKDAVDKVIEIDEKGNYSHVYFD
jgi:DNA repair exonuclease SbcCD ATPase subunit